MANRKYIFVTDDGRVVWRDVPVSAPPSRRGRGVVIAFGVLVAILNVVLVWVLVELFHG